MANIRTEFAVQEGKSLVMREDRTVCQVDSDWWEGGAAEALHYQRHEMGIWVPKCDYAQFAAGERPIRVVPEGGFYHR